MPILNIITLTPQCMYVCTRNYTKTHTRLHNYTLTLNHSRILLTKYLPDNLSPYYKYNYLISVNI